MELFGSYTSPFVRHCRVVMLQLGQPFRLVETDNAMSAQRSPTKRVPFLRDGDRFFTDSSTILRYARQKAGQAFLADIEDCERYHLATTALDTAVNLFLLEKDGVRMAQSPYLERQAARLASILETLHADPLPIVDSGSDGVLRVACFLEWALFRKRIALDPYPKLANFLGRAESIGHFAQTAPPVS